MLFFHNSIILWWLQKSINLKLIVFSLEQDKKQHTNTMDLVSYLSLMKKNKESSSFKFERIVSQ